MRLSFIVILKAMKFAEIGIAQKQPDGRRILVRLFFDGKERTISIGNVLYCGFQKKARAWRKASILELAAPSERNIFFCKSTAVSFQSI